jgi:hypothetical protein
MEVFFYRRQVMRVAIVHIGHGPDERDPFAQPPPYGAAADRKPVLVQLGDGMPNLYILLRTYLKIADRCRSDINAE